MSAGSFDFGALPGLPCDQEGPVFREPWEAQAFAIAVRLADSGHFTRAEWAQALGRQIRAAQANGDPDHGDIYYRHWLEALVTLCAERRLVLSEHLLRRTEEWRAAYFRTPHGRPVLLEGGA